MEDSKPLINREAHDKTKGFRLQKLRAVELMIDSSTLKDCVMFWAIEYQEDVYQNSESGELIEEDKSYADDSAFTFNSSEVRKALVSFVDLWIRSSYSEILIFNFYSTNKKGKERRTKVQTENNFEFPEGKLLDLAMEAELSDDFLKCATQIVLEEYESQYGKGKGNYKALSLWDMDTWKNFFSKINWLFEQPDEVTLNETVLTKIKDCKWFSHAFHCDMEDFIKSKLIDLLDERQVKIDYFQRTISKADVQLVFEKAKSRHSIEKEDPIWEMWSGISTPTDKRNVSEKLLAKWSDLTPSEIAKIARKAVEGGIERRSYESDKNFMAFRYRIYSCCQDKMDEILNRKGNIVEYSHVDCLNELIEEAKSKIEDLSKTFSYGFDSETLINNIILELVDNCYLAFDNE